MADPLPSGGLFKDFTALLSGKRTVLAAIGTVALILWLLRRGGFADAKDVPGWLAGTMYVFGGICALVLLFDGLAMLWEAVSEWVGKKIAKRKEVHRGLKNLKHPNELHVKVLVFLKRAGHQYFHTLDYVTLKEMKRLGLMDYADAETEFSENVAWKVPDAIWNEINKPDWAGNSVKVGNTPPWEPTSWRI